MSIVLRLVFKLGLFSEVANPTTGSEVWWIVTRCIETLPHPQRCGSLGLSWDCPGLEVSGVPRE